VWRRKESRDNRSAEAVARACNSLIDESPRFSQGATSII
jgi:hypothetical protein